MKVMDIRGNTISTTEINGETIGIYFRFGDTYTQKQYSKTLAFVEADKGEVHVDISDDQMPIGIQWINANGIAAVEIDKNFHYDTFVLQVLASQLAVISDTEKDKKDSLIHQIIQVFSYVIKNIK